MSTEQRQSGRLKRKKESSSSSSLDDNLEVGMFVITRGPPVKGLSQYRVARLTNVDTYNNNGEVSLVFEPDTKEYIIDLKERFKDNKAIFHGFDKPEVKDGYSSRVKVENERRRSEEQLLMPVSSRVKIEVCNDDDGAESDNNQHPDNRDSQAIAPAVLIATTEEEREAKQLFDNGVIDKRDDRGETPLINAAFDDKQAMVKALIKFGADVDKGHRDDKSPPLHFACIRGNEAVVRMLLDAGADADSTDKKDEGNTSLHMACCRAQEGCVRILVDAGANMDITDKNYGWTPLYQACKFGEEGCVRILLDAGANKDITDEDGKTPKDIALEMGHTNIVELL